MYQHESWEGRKQNDNRSGSAVWTLRGLLDLFDVPFSGRSDGDDVVLAETGLAGQDDRVVVEGTQVLAQAIVAVAKRFPDKSVRTATAVFSPRGDGRCAGRTRDRRVPCEGRSTATALVTATQNGKRCITVTVLADVPSEDVIRHELPKRPWPARTRRTSPRCPMTGRQLRLVDVVDVNSPDEVGPPGAVRLAALRPGAGPRRSGQSAGRVFHRGTLVFRRRCPGSRGHRNRAGT